VDLKEIRVGVWVWSIIAALLMQGVRYIYIWWFWKRFPRLKKN